MEKEIKTKVIIDLMKIRSHLLPNGVLNNQSIINPNITYCVLETIIAVLMDKYGIKSKDIRDLLATEPPQINEKE